MTTTLSQLYPDQMVPVKVIRLTRNKVAIIDPEDYVIASQRNWIAVHKKTVWYAKSRVPEPTVYLHSLITNFNVTDHYNGNGLDNRRNNLRPGARNNQNMFSSRNSSSKFKGVCWESRRQKWTVSITADNDAHWLGYFTDEVDAALAYDTAARMYHGNYGRYNFPREGEQSAIREDQPRETQYVRASAIGTSKFKGVGRNKNKWRAYIKINGVQKRLGTFTNEEDAARAYDAAARVRYGPHGRYNFPLPDEQSAVRSD